MGVEKLIFKNCKYNEKYILCTDLWIMKNTIVVQWTEIVIISQKSNDYISLTDMLKAKDGDFFISDWLRNRNTLEFLGIWEELNNPNFNYGEFASIKSFAWLNSFKISVKEWVERTNAIWIKATAWKYWWTFAHKDIAFEFGMWISPKFKLYLIKEFERLKELEYKNLSLEWNLTRNLAKINYKIHTDAIKEKLIPKEITAKQSSQIYASEADLLNVALFWKTAKEWQEENKSEKWNIRDFATIEQLVVLSNMESINSMLIHQWLKQKDRLLQLNNTAILQMKSLLWMNLQEKLEKVNKNL